VQNNKNPNISSREITVGKFSINVKILKNDYFGQESVYNSIRKMAQ